MHQLRGASRGNTWQSEASPSLKMPHVSDLTFDGLIITIIIAAIIIVIVKITNINGQWSRQTGRQIIWFLEWAKTARGQLGSKQRMPIVKELVGTSCKIKNVHLLSSSKVHHINQVMWKRKRSLLMQLMKKIKKEIVSIFGFINPDLLHAYTLACKSFLMQIMLILSKAILPSTVLIILIAICICTTNSLLFIYKFFEWITQELCWSVSIFGV